MDIFSFQEHQMWIPGNRYCRPEFAAKRISGERGREGELDWMTGSICILLQVLVSNTPCLVTGKQPADQEISHLTVDT